jgi:hypothetical protein
MMIKLKHKRGYFGTPEVNNGHLYPYDEYSYFDDDENPYYLEFTEIPFSLIAVELTGTRLDLSESFSIGIIKSNIDEGAWVEFND